MRHEAKQIGDLASQIAQETKGERHVSMHHELEHKRGYLEVFVDRFSRQVCRERASIEVLLSINDLFDGSESDPIRAALITENVAPAATSLLLPVWVQQQ